MTPLRRWKRDEGGQAAVEFALVLPFLLIMLIGIVEFGRAWNEHQVLTDAARETARRASLPDPIEQVDAEQVAKDALAGAGINSDSLTFTWTNFEAGSNQILTLGLELPYQFTFFGPLVKWATGQSRITLQTSFSIRNE